MILSHDPSHEDLRSFLHFVRGKGPGHYQVIERPISPRWSTSALIKALAERLRNPVIEFRNVEGSELPIVTNVCASIDRVARSVGITSDVLHDRFSIALNHPVPPAVVSADKAPLRDVERGPEEFSLADLPSLIYTVTQTSPYITSAVVVAFDPDTGAHNLSFNRFMIAGDRTAAVYMTPGSDLDRIWNKNRSRGKSTPLALAIGTHPLWCYGALVAGALDHDDYGVVGAVLDGPLLVTPTRVDERLLVPARAEIVLEGFIEASETVAEGPFGEFLGYDAEKAPRPLVTFTHMASRRAPIYQDIVAGQVEHLTMSSVSLRARLQRDYFGCEPAIVDFWLPAPMTVFLAIDADRLPVFDAKAFMARILRQEAYLKFAYAFDSDVDLRKLSSVQTALACFNQPAEDLLVLADCSGNGVDPSESDGRTSKVAIDARARRSMTRSEVPTDVFEEIDLSSWLS